MIKSTASQVTPRVFFLDLEVDRVPEKGEPPACITQIALYDPLRKEKNRIFEAYITPPAALNQKYEKTSFNPNKQESTVEKHPLEKVWPTLKTWVNKKLQKYQPAVIVGHNIYKHDWEILKNECTRIQEVIPKHWKPFCTLYLAGALGIPEGERSLSSLCQRYQVKHLPQHIAKNDVLMTVEVFNEMTKGADPIKIANAMALPSGGHPVREVAKLAKMNQTTDAVKEIALVFFDFEATGLFPEEGENKANPRATELGAYIPSTGSTFTSLIDPGQPLSEEIVKITGITDEMIRTAAQEYKEKTGNEMNFKAVWTDFEAWMHREIGPTAQKAVVLAGHNIWKYDLKLYKAECERLGMKFQFRKSIDTCSLSKHLYKGHKPQPKGFHKLEELAKRMGVTDHNAHRALGDVIANAKVWDTFVDGVPKEKLNKALLSGHPILSTGQAVREEGGTFDPADYMASKESSSSSSSSLAAEEPAVVPAVLPESSIAASDTIVEPVKRKRPLEEESIMCKKRCIAPTIDGATSNKISFTITLNFNDLILKRMNSSNSDWNHHIEFEAAPVTQQGSQSDTDDEIDLTLQKEEEMPGWEEKQSKNKLALVFKD